MPPPPGPRPQASVQVEGVTYTLASLEGLKAEDLGYLISKLNDLRAAGDTTLDAFIYATETAHARALFPPDVPLGPDPYNVLASRVQAAAAKQGLPIKIALRAKRLALEVAGNQTAEAINRILSDPVQMRDFVAQAVLQARENQRLADDEQQGQLASDAWHRVVIDPLVSRRLTETSLWKRSALELAISRARQELPGFLADYNAWFQQQTDVGLDAQEELIDQNLSGFMVDPAELRHTGPLQFLRETLPIRFQNVAVPGSASEVDISEIVTAALFDYGIAAIDERRDFGVFNAKLQTYAQRLRAATAHQPSADQLALETLAHEMGGLGEEWWESFKVQAAQPGGDSNFFSWLNVHAWNYVNFALVASPLADVLDPQQNMDVSLRNLAGAGSEFLRFQSDFAATIASLRGAAASKPEDSDEFAAIMQLAEDLEDQEETLWEEFQGYLATRDPEDELTRPQWIRQRVNEITQGKLESLPIGSAVNPTDLGATIRGLSAAQTFDEFKRQAQVLASDPLIPANRVGVLQDVSFLRSVYDRALVAGSSPIGDFRDIIEPFRQGGLQEQALEEQFETGQAFVQQSRNIQEAQARQEELAKTQLLGTEDPATLLARLGITRAPGAGLDLGEPDLGISSMTELLMQSPVLRSAFQNDEARLREALKQFQIGDDTALVNAVASVEGIIAQETTRQDEEEERRQEIEEISGMTVLDFQRFERDSIVKRFDILRSDVEQERLQRALTLPESAGRAVGAYTQSLVDKAQRTGRGFRPPPIQGVSTGELDEEGEPLPPPMIESAERAGFDEEALRRLSQQEGEQEGVTSARIQRERDQRAEIDRRAAARAARLAPEAQPKETQERKARRPTVRIPRR